MIDPIALSLVAWELRDGEYVEVANVGADASWTAELPYPLTIRPGELIR